MPINMNTNKNTKSITVVMAYPVLLHQFHRYEVAMHLRPRHRPGRRLCLGVNQSVPAKNARTSIRSLTAIPRAGSRSEERRVGKGGRTRWAAARSETN